MKRQIIILNGVSQSGKDTMIHYMQQFIPNIKSLSYVALVKRVASELGWNGEKDEAGRRFLAGLVNLVDNYNDYIFKDLCKHIDYKSQQFMTYIVVVRDPRNIQKFVSKYGDECVTAFIERDGISIPNNPQDQAVLNYKYDVYIKNNKDLKEFKKQINKFVRLYIKNKKRMRAIE